jgi:3-oxoacyl-(acyl-carrier-protein) synthase
MKPIDVIAFGAVSALGAGRAAFSVGALGDAPSSAIAEDPELRAAGFKRPFAARVRLSEEPSVALDRAGRLLALAASDLAGELDRVLPGWQERRLGWAVGTSGGGMPSAVRVFERRARGEAVAPELARAAPYFGPLAALEIALGVVPSPRAQLLAACASSTFAIGLACRWLAAERADLVVAGGYDALSVFIAAGFEVLGATSAASPAPFRKERDGMSVGEGAVLVALVRSAPEATAPLGRVLGFGASSDAVHVTAPDPSGAGLARAARAALDDAGVGAGDVDLVSAHATATPLNDAAETQAMNAVLGSRAARVVVHPFKAVIGHALGAGGALEALAALDAIERGLLPGAAGSGAVADEFEGRLLERNESGAPRCCLKLSSAFGGANAALVLGGDAEIGEGAAQPLCGVALWAHGLARSALDLDEVAPLVAVERAKLGRLDELSAVVVAAVASALGRLDRPLPERTGIVVGSATATLEINDAFDRRRRERGAAAVEPRRFPATSPNLSCGQCSIAFRLLGPSLAVGSDPAASLEALEVAHDLLEARDADALVVVAVESTGPVVRDVWLRAGWPLPCAGARAVVLGRGRPGEPLLDRSSLAVAHARARGAGGRLDGAEPGWPTLWRALALKPEQ